MLPLRIAGATRRLAEYQDEYFALSIRDETIGGVHYMSSLWELTPGEHQAILDGGAIYCGIAGTSGHIPAALVVPDATELAQLRDGGHVYLTIPGAVHPPVCMGVVAKSDLDKVSAPVRAMVMIGVQPLPEEVAP